MITVYDVLRRPIVTEKSNFQSGKLGQYVFEVAPAATKSQIKEAVETLFDVQVERVNVMKVPPKRSASGAQPAPARPPRGLQEGCGHAGRGPDDRPVRRGEVMASRSTSRPPPAAAA